MKRYLSNAKFWAVVRWLHSHLNDWQLSIKGVFQWLRVQSLQSIYTVLFERAVRYISLDVYSSYEMKQYTMKTRSKDALKVKRSKVANHLQCNGAMATVRRERYAASILTAQFS